MKKALYLVTGLPGSGKTTFANTILDKNSICEADNFFIDKDGYYKFDATKLKEAHEWCRNEVEIRMKDNQVNPQFYPQIAVTNTSTQEWELIAYIDLAEKYDYEIHFVIVENRHDGKMFMVAQKKQ